MRKRWFWKYYALIVGIGLTFSALACNASLAPPSMASPTPTATATATQESSEPGTPVPTAGGEAATESTEAEPATAAPTATTPCNYDSVYVDDVTIPDGTEIVTGAGFTKTWRLQNNGCLPWPDGTVLLFVEGNQMGGPVSVPVPATAVNGTQDISVSLTAPATPGEHKGYWRLRSSDGIQFGDKIYVKINAVSPTPVPPTATFTLPPPAIAFPDLYVSEFSLNPSTPVQGSPVHVRIGIYNKGTAATGGAFVVQWYGGENFASPSCQWTLGNLVKNGGFIKECDFVFNSWYGNINTKVIVDVGDAIEESDETNNIFLKAISVAKP